jgi:hypothetical protein
VLATRGRLLVQEAGAVLQSVRDVGSDPAGLLRIMLPVRPFIEPWKSGKSGHAPSLSLTARVPATRAAAGRGDGLRPAAGQN